MSLDRARHATRSIAGRRAPARTIGRRGSRGILAVSALLLVGGLAPGMTATAAPSTGATARHVHRVAIAGARPVEASVPARHASGAGVGPSSLEPTIHYEDAIAHQRDRIAFVPGERVRVAFTPRAGDAWQVAGGMPRPLPAGRLTGHAMRVARDVPSSPATSPVDRPIVPAAYVVAARGAVFHPGEGAGGIQLAAAVDPGALRREVFGFLPYWELASSSTTFDWETLSTIAYFGVGVDAAGNLMKRNADGSTTVGWSGWTSARMTSVMNTAHANHTRVVLTVQSFAWNTSGRNRQKALLGSPTARARLAAQIVTAVRDRGADGVNLDFEPIASGYADEFTALVRAVRARLNATARGYQLTFDTMGSIGNYPIEAATASGGADAIVIMGYDYRSSGSSPVGSIAPMGGPRYDVAETIAAYVSRVPASRLILGVPYYGRAWSTATATLGARNISGAKYGASTTATYETARTLAAKYGRQYDPVEGVAWTAYRRQNCTATYGCVNPWRQLYFDDVRALSTKYDLINRYGLRGAGIWALGYDGSRPELHAALKAKFIADKIPPTIISTSLSAPAFSPNRDGVGDRTTAAMRVTGLITWGYRIQPVTGATLGRPLRSGTIAGKNPMVTWDGTRASGAGVADGRYVITLWAADASNNRSQRQFSVTVDRRPAKTLIDTGIGYLTPDGDRRSDSLLIGWRADEVSSGVARLANASGRTVRSWSFSNRTSWRTNWAGTNTRGVTVSDGRYVIRLDSRDRAGNRSVVERTILVDRTIRGVRWSRAAFDPRAREASRVSFTLRRQATITLAIYQGSTLVRQVTTRRTYVAGSYGWTWSGKTSTGTYASPGVYRAVVTARSWIGTTSFARNVTILRH